MKKFLANLVVKITNFWKVFLIYNNPTAIFKFIATYKKGSAT